MHRSNPLSHSKSKTGKPRPASKGVVKKQDKDYTEGDFGKALRKATERVERPSAPDPGSPRT